MGAAKEFTSPVRAAQQAPERRQTARHGTGIARSGYASRSCEAGPSRGALHQHTQTAAGDLPDSVRLQSAALHSTSQRPMNSSIGSLLCYVPFHSLNPAETGREDARIRSPASRVVLMQTVGFRARADLAVALSVGMA